MRVRADLKHWIRPNLEIDVRCLPGGGNRIPNQDAQHQNVEQRIRGPLYPEVWNESKANVKSVLVEQHCDELETA